jgi:hypothetical protein
MRTSTHARPTRRLTMLVRTRFITLAAEVLLILALVTAGLGGTAGPARAAVAVTAIPCTDYVSGGACAYSYNITMLPTDKITNLQLSIGGPGVSTAQFEYSGTGALGAATFSGVSSPIYFSYTPHAGASGTDSISWQVTSELGYGARGNSASPGVITITIASPVPTANNASISTAYDTTGSTTLSASNNPTSFAIASGPSHGAASISGSTTASPSMRRTPAGHRTSPPSR